MASRYLGVDLAWRDDRPGLPANETGVAVIDSRGQVLDVAPRARRELQRADRPARPA